MEIIEDKLTDDVIPMMVVYACVGVILAIVELVSVVLACAYVAQINRRTSKKGCYFRFSQIKYFRVARSGQLSSG